MTIKDILELKSFDKVKVIAGEEGMNNKINNVYFMEVPDIFSFIDSNGLLLTTLYPIAHDKEAIERFLPKLVDKKISAIGIKPGRYIDEIPQVMLDQANTLDLPLLVLPDDANLSVLSNGILEALLDKKNSMLEFRDDVHNQLIKLLLEGSDLTKLVKSLSAIIKSPVLLINERLELITSSINPKQISVEKRVAIKQSYRNVENIKDTIQISIYGHNHLEEDIIFNPIIAGEECLGYFIALPSNLEYRINIKVALEQASLLSAFLFLKEEAVLQKERNHLDSFVRDLLNQKIKSQLEIMQKAKVFKWDLDFPVILLNIEELSNDESIKKGFYAQMKDIEMIERIISEKLDLPLQKCKVIHHDDGLICFISVLFENRKNERLRVACESVINYYKNKYKLGISKSRIVEKLTDLKEAYDEAKVATKIFRILEKKEAFIRSYDDLGVYKIIHHISDRNVLKEYVNSKIGVLLNTPDTDMLDMISCLIKNNFNLQKTAKELFIHYNTLRYRLEKLKESGIDFNNGFDLAEVALAYKIHIYLELGK
ncbi:PucR family transcriptional regulator [Bacillus sp. B-jedd]|uniref:PucR family transcriptional regulator n=1 Tax=Bacillus sp. B-jedd TaxID=1476857 RepID=UPI001E6391B3|nr:PucR family transcriptional regulator [Bacillus sp. B-jedd]